MTGYEELGPVAGRGGAVRARRLSDGAEVVLKRLSGAGSEAWLEQVTRRAEWLARMGHPALPRIFEVTAEGSGLVIVMEYAAGGSLADRLAGGGTLRPGVVAELFSTLGEGLEVAHQAGVLHLDLKPSNILFRANGDAFLSDFGHDRLLETTGQPTPGAAEYLDPAVAEGSPPDAQADVYALAALSYQALTGSPPFSGESVVELAEARRGDPLRPVAEVVGGLPALLAGAVERGLARRREDRFPTAAAFAEALLPGEAPPPAAAPPLLRQVEAVPPAPPTSTPVREPPPGRPYRARPPSRWPVGAAVLAAVILVAGVVAIPTLLRGVGLHGTPTTHLLVGPTPSLPKPDPPLPSLPVVEVPTSTPSGPSPSPAPHPTPVAPTPAATRRPIPAPPTRAPVPVLAPSRGPIPPPPLPPKGQRIAFTGTKEGRPSIYVTDPAGSVVLRLTNGPVGEDTQPVWSPDGTRIAFSSSRDGSWQIYLMNADGSNPHRLTGGPGNSYDPAWDPTSATIAYVNDRTGTPQVYAIGALGGKGEYAGPAPAQNYTLSTFAQPVFSPDGQTLAGTVLLSGTVIITWKVSGALIAGLNTPAVPHVEHPAWSPNGSQIVYGSSDGKVQVWVMAPDGSGKKALTTGPSNNAEPRFSPTGDRILFVSDRVGLRQVWAMSPDGSHQAPVVNVAGETYDPSWA
jgi:Tol biopolymer transport system component/serine/threonine protein kinase